MVPSIEEGRIVLIANPVSKSGRGAVAASEAARLFRERVGEERFELLTTARPLHGEELARDLPDDVGCVIALGGDGLVNEVVNGLMARKREDRPALAVIPVGSGNDYAETLGMAYAVPTAVTEILRFQTKRADVGRVNGRYFAETLSFGLDAAIALDTVDRRQKSGRAGTMLYLESAVDQLFKHLRLYDFKMNVLAAEPGCAPHPEQDEAYLVAVQVGPTYGGHFRITPKARFDDGLFDICWATPELAPMRALALLLRARGGKHTGSSHIHFRRAQRLVLDFEEEPPAQMDGEKVSGTHFVIDCVPDALTVVVGQR
ncbi:diacylglycerol/lipid kinase family protein [Adlercreutzia shanghongiae]|uniref:YegS/Rv2252/BmrU family lipid kinase n=1 Tax=Adlercreutzia shanghongiae TaxID=3111773 RepID=A0ABU6IXF1_9ACTN|nr:YegS/Rv2252/BmrU family lipid kinase [Adlercreutzia sp. R22]MEC4294527.1 YegS/Rv2252/BmrU family lipid kinase [Adlercreutzia sp. R22]